MCWKGWWGGGGGGGFTRTSVAVSWQSRLCFLYLPRKPTSPLLCPCSGTFPQPAKPFIHWLNSQTRFRVSFTCVCSSSDNLKRVQLKLYLPKLGCCDLQNSVFYNEDQKRGFVFQLLSPSWKIFLVRMQMISANNLLT